MKPRIIIVGDVMLDCIMSGEVTRFSPEAADVPVVLCQQQYSTPGGAGNVAANVMAMDCDPTLIAAVGGDPAGDAIMASFRDTASAFIQVSDMVTTTKVRIVVGGQLSMRIDTEAHAELSSAVTSVILQSVSASMMRSSAVVISDYAKGAVTPWIAAEVIRMARTQKIPVIVDTKQPLAGQFIGATVMKPNLREIAAALGMAHLPDTDTQAGNAAFELWERCKADHVILTRGVAGITIADVDGVRHLPAHAVEAVDVTGAGDSVAAALAVALARGDGIEDAATFANAAGAVAVSNRGTHAATVEEIARFDGLGAKRHASMSQAFGGLGDMISVH